MPEQRLAPGAAGTQAYHDLVRGRDGLLFRGLPPALVDLRGELPKGQLAEPLQVRLLEKILQRGLDPFRRVDLPFQQPFAEILGRQVDVHELVRLAEHRVRNPLADPDVGRLLHDVVEAFQVLDVQRGDDVDPLGQDVLDILVPFGVPAAGNVGVRQFVDEGYLGFPGEDGVEVHLLEDHAPVFLAASRDDVESLDQFRGFRPAVGLHKPDDDVDSLVLEAVPFQEHLVCFPDAGAVPEVDLQPSAPRAADQSEKRVGPFFLHIGSILPPGSGSGIGTFAPAPGAQTRIADPTGS